MENVNPETVVILHTAIEKYTRGKAQEVDSAVRLFLPNDDAYDKWKEEVIWLNSYITFEFSVDGRRSNIAVMSFTKGKGTDFGIYQGKLYSLVHL